jgi:nucleotide-binding universal stress UspA family protein
MLARRFDAAVELLHVVENPFLSGAWSPELYAPSAPELLENVIAEADRRLGTLRTGVTDQSVAAAAKVVTGRPEQMIVEYANAGGFDLIVMGTHGRTGLSHLFMGSVAERVVRKAACPVLTVRDPKAIEQWLTLATADAVA